MESEKVENTEAESGMVVYRGAAAGELGVVDRRQQRGSCVGESIHLTHSMMPGINTT